MKKENIIIIGKGRKTYYYNKENNTISDKYGNTIKLSETIDTTIDCSFYIIDLFSKIYKAQNEAIRCIKANERDDTRWSTF